MKILIVDDKADNIYMLETLLKSDGYEVVSAVNGAEALENLRSEGADMIISDILMPVMDGFRLCQEVRADETLKHIPFIFYTGTYTDEKDEGLALKIGADKFLRKPMEPDEFIKIIQGVIRDAEEGKLRPQEPALRKTEETFQLYSERLVKKLEKKMLDLEKEITERNLAEERLRERTYELVEREQELRASRDYLEKLTNSMWDTVFSVKMPERVIEWANDSFRLIGYEPSECVGKTTDFLYPDKSEFLDIGNKLKNAIAVGKDVLHTEQLLRRKSGEVFPAEITVTFHKEKDEVDSVTSIIRDISERKQAEEEKKKLEAQLRQAQKMESIGTLAGGIAHDFNNILFPLFGYTELALDDTEKGTPLHDNLQEVFSAAKRATDLVKQILTLSRQADQKLKPLQVYFVVREALKLIRSTLPSTIEIKQYISNTCGLVMADAAQIHQVAMNLLTNAFHAMEDEGGKLDVTLKEIDLDVDDLKDPAMVPGPYVCLTVADTGTGIDESVIDRIFDPYFSTKEKHKGTGLGLSMVHGIVKSFKGNILVSSKPGKGTTFHVYLPVIQTRAETKETRVISPVEMGTERILFVDDEEQIVRMSHQMLEGLGYHVTARTSSIETLEAFRAAPDKFDLVITDTTMPNMTGVELAKKLMEIRSDIPIIICTGFSEKISADKAKAMGIRGYVMKPVVRSQLAKKIREVLDQS